MFYSEYCFRILFCFPQTIKIIPAIQSNCFPVAHPKKFVPTAYLNSHSPWFFKRIKYLPSKFVLKGIQKPHSFYMYLSIAHGFPKDFNSPWQGSMPRLNLHSIGEIGSFPGWFGLGLVFFKKPCWGDDAWCRENDAWCREMMRDVVGVKNHKKNPLERNSIFST